jgi:oligopeptide/dipeptide ABC transporter ATP-binding protein
MATRTILRDVVLQVESLSVEYATERGVAKAVQGVSLQLKRGETLGIVGESGSGKSTLAFAVLGLLQSPPARWSGKIFFQGSDISSLGEDQVRKIRGNKIAMIFQDPMTSLNPVKKIGSHFVEYIRAHEPSVTEEEAISRTKALMRDLGISPSRINDYPHQFSGGMRQRVMIGLALALKPDLIIADEPTTALDVIVEAQILELLKDLKEKYSLSLILITHNLGIVAQMADRVAVMYSGKLAEVAPTLKIFEEPNHPYTQALLQSIPTVEGGRRTLKVIPGFPPDLTDPPPGCPFHPRCPYVFDRCRTEEPKLQPTGEGATAACHLLDRKR